MSQHRRVAGGEALDPPCAERMALPTGQPEGEARGRIRRQAHEEETTMKRLGTGLVLGAAAFVVRA